MTATPPPAAPTRQPADLRQQITDALVEVRASQAVVDHCPSLENEEFLTAARYRLDRLLDRLPRDRETT